MKILLYVTDAADTAVRMRLKDGEPDVQAVRRTLNPFDEIACEAAVALKEKGLALSVTAIAVGGRPAREALLRALAMGADEGLFVEAGQTGEFERCRILESVMREGAYDALFSGKLNTDTDEGFASMMAGARLGIPVVSNVHRLEETPEGFSALSTTEGGVMRTLLRPPFVLTADLRLANPRYVTLPAMMRAKKKAVLEKKLEDFGLKPEVAARSQGFAYPVKTVSKTVLPDAQALLAALRQASDR